jgi:LAO/AO transport system kinase
MTIALAAGILRGEVRAAAQLISRLEAGDGSISAALSTLYAQGGRTPIIGITGPPGSGKSTLVDQLIAQLRVRGQRVAVLAVDPSSPVSGGAILGDRIRMGRHNSDAGVFIRSMAARGQLGGLARAAGDALIVLDAMGWDTILVETVGVGQSEMDILRHALTVVIVQTPAGGDAIQTVKAGLLEIGDLFVMNKSDMAGADRACAALREAVEFRNQALPPHAWRAPVQQTQAVEATGVSELVRHIETHRAHLIAHPAQLRVKQRSQAQALLAERVAELLRTRQTPAVEHASHFERVLDELVARRCDPSSAALQIIGY